MSSPTTESNNTMGGYADLPPEQRPGYVPPIQFAAPLTAQPSEWNYTARVPQQGVPQPPRNFAGPGGPLAFTKLTGGLSYTSKPVVETRPPVNYTQMPQQHQQPRQPPPRPDQIPMHSPPMQSPPIQHLPYPQEHHLFPQGPPPPPPGPPPNSSSQPFPQMRPQDYPPPPPQNSIYNRANIKEVVPGGASMPPPPNDMRGHRLSVNGPRPDMQGLGNRMDRLSVSGNEHRPSFSHRGSGSGPGLPPPSPLLEAYHGTYQSISPMPSPLMMPRFEDDDLDDLPPLDHRRTSASTSGAYVRRRRTSSSASASNRPVLGRKTSASAQSKKRVTLYDAEADARDIAEALSRSSPDYSVLIEILPTLSHDQLMELRQEYKRVCKIQGRGINIAKHIKLKTSGNLCKIAYVVALGRWESESYWANFWYQSNSARRELLIESLMGRTNQDIREIKASFKDKRYSDSLTKCMSQELKADKFRHAILLALEERRQEETDAWPIEYRNRDVDALYEALKRREGGESAMLEICITRSDGHLRECLRTYERKYQGNFAKDALRKSHNLVGEVIAHILNGVINRPARDALLLHHALTDLAPPAEPTPRSSGASLGLGAVGGSGSGSSGTKHDRKDRAELLISRLVRLHWDRGHMMRVKEEYREKYRHYLEEDIEDYVRAGDFQDFCLNLCEGSR
ncbi:Annexin [Aulographum hederae CBS 113979]|uniref:Annexin n=1 Tax=Aulographum hederae CBS 113979 TaxID=1176131 RepID=A0A6G1GS69_9PEZI|nr:Annexin [Aulographum hederae CBS 113979]